MEGQWKVFNKRMIKGIEFKRDGFLIDVILQNCITRDVLFGASMTKETLLETIEKGVVVLYSKSRGMRWLKGEISGDYLKVVNITLNCEKNQLLIVVLPISAGACHKKDKKGNTKSTCFYRTLLEVNVMEINGKYYRIKNREKEEVEFYFGYGWLSSDELFNLRRINPCCVP